MRGTLVCALTNDGENGDAVTESVELSERLGLRLVLTHVVDGMPGLDDEGGESVSMRGNRVAAERRLEELAREHGVGEIAARRVAVGDPAAVVGQIAGEEAADVIVVGARSRGWGRRGLESKLARELETETPVPVLVAPPRRRARKRAASNGRPQR
jgi:nucleotide-binding universal stress UspA family protein